MSILASFDESIHSMTINNSINHSNCMCNLVNYKMQYLTWHNIHQSREVLAYKPVSNSNLDLMHTKFKPVIFSFIFKDVPIFLDNWRYIFKQVGIPIHSYMSKQAFVQDNVLCLQVIIH